MHTAIIVILAVVVVLSIGIGRAYQFVPLAELKRRARSGNKLAKNLYKVACYPSSAQFVLWLIAIIASVAFFIVLVRKSPAWVVFVSGATLVWIGYVWVPRSAANIIFEYLAQIIAPPFGWVLQYINPPIDYIVRKTGRNKKKHTNIFDKEDLSKLFALQQQQEDNRIDSLELEMLKRVLYFGDHRVRDIMIPKRKVKSVSISDLLSPIILDELHATGHVFFPVHEDKKTNIVGTVDITRAVHLKHTASVREIMDDRLIYIHEEDSLVDLLRQLLKAHYPIMIVVDETEEYTGVVTIKDLVSELVGEETESELELYEDNPHEVDQTSDERPKIDGELVE